MEIIRGLSALEVASSVVTMGAFDGVHLGHRAVIDKLKEVAQRENLPSILLSFEPHPQYVLYKHTDLKLLTTLEEKEELVSSLGIDYFVVLKFNDHLKHLSYKDFLHEFLIDKLHAKWVVIGYDHHFGRHKGGNRETLEGFSESLGFGIEVVKEEKIRGQDVKSSRIRHLLEKGKIEEANRYLGYNYEMSGLVHRATGRGAKLGFPTANIELPPHKLVPAHGVYVAKARLEGGEELMPGITEIGAVVNIGVRPTFNEEQRHIECFLIDFQGKIYGKRLEVTLLHRLRGEIRFSEVEALKTQILHDVARARKLL